ncbi:ATPase [Striga asiatica]|uniref:Phospholipid-transporting ATPase n=1 Tax=Striga asiatica TaxID=4170 RepID=A0A5A7P9R5_STRAF|nr:ATPase [Striga asiatica]
MSGGPQPKGIQFSRLYSFSCFRSSFRDEHSQIGQKGYSRVVYCNEPDSSEQLLLSPLAPYAASSILAPLLLVIGTTMAKEGIEDWRRRKQDIEANNRKVKVCSRYQNFQYTRWKNLRVGDLVKVHKDEYFPADLLLLSSSYEDGICYVETMNLDGETNLKVRHALDVTSSLNDDNSIRKFKAVIKCEDPNEDLYTFVGTLYYEGQQYPLSLQQFLLRDSKLRNTEYAYGVVVFTGHDTKVMQNATDPPSKRSKIEKRMDQIIYVLFSMLMLVSFIGSFFFGISTKNDIEKNGTILKRWYLRPDETTVFFDPEKSALAAFFHFLTGLMLYGYLIPISLYVSIELVKVLQSIFINQDRDMYFDEGDKPARARTSNLNEELGQVDTILSDKTGTLTCNSMDFVKCTVGGVAYGRGMTEVEKALAKRKNNEAHEDDIESLTPKKKTIKSFNFSDERIMDGRWVYEPHAEIIQKFFRVLALCQTAIPDFDRETGEVTYEAESPDEAAFVIAARELGFEFFERTQTSIALHELDHKSGRKIESVMFERLSDDVQDFMAVTKDHIKKYAEAGLRTLVVAYRELSESEFRSWEEEFLMAQTSLTADRDALVEECADKIERNLVLLGATAVEDKLQKGVPECITKLENAGIKIWVITGDKMETAINIGYACSLLRDDMKQIVITLDSSEITELEKHGDKEVVAKASSTSITNQIREGKLQLSLSGGNSAAFGLIIDGKSLAFALNKNLEDSFLDLAMNCASVICCRSTPKQKALVTRLVKKVKGRTTLAIGDGANDVGMLQEADIGVGISGVEGMQASMSSDFAIAQFRFLERLLLVHGHWCYRRISMMICYFFYKNIAFGFTLFWFEAHASFSGQPAYNDWYMSTYNVFFTSLPVIALGVFDQDVSARLCLKYPALYREGVDNILFSWTRVLGWISNGILTSMIIFFFTTKSGLLQAFRHDGHSLDYEVLGVLMYTCVVWTVNCQLALSINYFTWIQHLVIWGSTATWHVFLLVYGSITPVISTTAYRVFVEACATSAFYWLVTLLVVVSALMPYYLYRALQTEFCPMVHDVIQRMRVEGGGPLGPDGPDGGRVIVERVGKEEDTLLSKY